MYVIIHIPVKITKTLDVSLRDRRLHGRLKVFFDTNMCHPNVDESLCPECLEAQQSSGIDVKRLLLQLAQSKYEYYPQSQELSDKEIKYLCLSLSRYSKGEIAYYFYKHKIPNTQELAACENIERWIKNLNSEMSTRIHRYLKRLMNLTDENQRMPSWRKIILFLESRGYAVCKIRMLETKQLRMLVEGEISLEQLDNHVIQEINDYLKKIGMVNLKISQVIEHS